MMPRSALSLVGILVLVLSLTDVEGNVSHRRTRGRTLARNERKLGIGYQGRLYADSSKSKSGVGKEGSKAGNNGSYKPTSTPTSKPTEDSISGRIPVIDPRTDKPTPAWFEDKEKPDGPGATGGRNDGSGENHQTTIGVIGNATDSSGSNNNDNEGSDGSDGINGGNIIIEAGNGNEGENDSDGKQQPGDVDNGGSSVGIDVSTGGVTTGGDSDTGNGSNTGSDSATGNGSESGIVTGTGSGNGSVIGAGSESGNGSESGAGSESGNDSGAGAGSESGNGKNEETQGNTSIAIGGVTGGGGSDTEAGESDEAGKGGDKGEGKGDGKGEGKGKGDGDSDGTGDENNGRNEDNGVDVDNTDTTPKIDVSNPSTVEDWGTVPDDAGSDVSTAVFCPDVSVDKEVLINWIYAVEFVSDMSVEEKAQAVTIMELKLVSEILECNNQVALPGKLRNRQLTEDGVAGLNYLPLDAKNENVVCFYSDTNSTGGVCETYFGRMEMYLTADTVEQVAITSMLYKIRDVFQRSNFPAVDGIIRVWYLDPQLDSVDGIVDGGVVIGDGTPPPDSSYSTGTMIAFAALGISVFAALILGAFRMRRNENDVITTFDQSTVTGSAKTPNTGAFVLPNSYKLDDAHGMRAIPEDDDADSRYNCSVIVSDGGFTSDGDSREGDPSFRANFDNVLGSNTDEDGDLNNDMLFQSSNDYSEHRRNILVSGADVGLGVKHSTVDVHQCTSARCTICNYKPKDVEFVHKSPTTPDVSTGSFFPDDEANDAEIL